MNEVVYLLGAGFNHSIVDQHWRRQPPLARDFFQVLIRSPGFREAREMINQRIYVDLLLDEIQRIWHLSLDDLEREPFDIEECMTLFESQLLDKPGAERELEIRRAAYALRALLLMHLGEMLPLASTPAAIAFGAEVMRNVADVLTLNYDAAAETALEFASGAATKPKAGLHPPPAYVEQPISDENLDASGFTWKRSLAYGFKFDEVPVPAVDGQPYVSGDRYYAHPANQLYENTRVLHLHGSIDWLTYTDRRLAFDEGKHPQPTGIVLGTSPCIWESR